MGGTKRKQRGPNLFTPVNDTRRITHEAICHGVRRAGCGYAVTLTRWPMVTGDPVEEVLAVFEFECEAEAVAKLLNGRL